MSCRILAAFFMEKSWPNILKVGIKNEEAVQRPYGGRPVAPEAESTQSN